MAIAILMTLHGASPLLAQSSAECTLYATTLASGGLVRADSQARAYAGIQRCPAALRGQAIAQAIARRRQVGSLADHQTELFAFASRDQPVFDQLASLSSDRSATPVARVLAIATVLRMVDAGPPGAGFEVLTRFREGGTCFISGSPISRVPAGARLSADSVQRALRTFQDLERSRSAEPSVRSAAHCAANVLRLRELGVLGVLAPLNTSDLAISHDCDNRFSIRNRSEFPYAVSIGVAGSTRRAGLLVEGTRGKKAEVVTLYDPGSGGSVEMTVDDVAKYTAANSRRSCRPRK
jgi:hypothetical protein